MGGDRGFGRCRGVKQEVGGEFPVFFTRKVGLDSLPFAESQTYQLLQSVYRQVS